ncbi:MAG: demethoxyubiquinone hydroxylase family protein [Deltaproteobacteria bacterium]|nr:demethoxyubiquinone hydroxylase family protein [Deltaproteobacteria bacterium]
MPTTFPKALIKLIRGAYSGEKAAAYAYQGHARSITSAEEKNWIKKIEDEEWDHRKYLKEMMQEYGLRPSLWLEIKMALIGQIISLACHLIGYFMPMYFAGRLESGNVEEYLEMKRLFNSIDIHQHDKCLEEMAAVEKEHELYFLSKVEDHPWLKFFMKIFKWGPGLSFNDYQLENKRIKNQNF